MARVVIIGATSAIAQATARLLCPDEPSFLLVGRTQDRLSQLADDLIVRGAKSAATYVEGAGNHDGRHSDDVLQASIQELEAVETVLIAQGILPIQPLCKGDPSQIREVFEVNCVKTILHICSFSAYFQEKGVGTIGVITSVAGDRGRPSNLLYAATKGAVSIFLEGLAGRLHGTGINVIDIKPGFVDTPMTESFNKSGPLWSSPERVAKDIVRALKGGSGVIYSPWYWRYIMAIVRRLPRFIVRRL